MILKLRMWLVFKLIGRQPVVANVEIGGVEGYAVTGRGTTVWTNGHVLMQPMPMFTACMRITSGTPWQKGDPLPEVKDGV